MAPRGTPAPVQRRGKETELPPYLGARQHAGLVVRVRSCTNPPGPPRDMFTLSSGGFQTELGQASLERCRPSSPESKRVFLTTLERLVTKQAQSEEVNSEGQGSVEQDIVAGGKT